MRISLKSECKDTRDHNCICHSYKHTSHYYIERCNLIHRNTNIAHNVMVTKSTQAPEMKLLIYLHGVWKVCICNEG